MFVFDRFFCKWNNLGVRGSFHSNAEAIVAKKHARLLSSRAKVLEPSDKELVLKYRAGDQSAFKVLYDRHVRVLTKIALSMTYDDIDKAEDAVELCWLKVFRSIHTFKEQGDFKAWIIRVLRNVIKDYAKQGSHKYCISLPDGDDFHHLADPARDPLEEMIREEDAARLLVELRGVPDSVRVIFFMVHVEERSYKEVARIQNTTVEAVKMRVHRAKRMLQQAVTR